MLARQQAAKPRERWRLACGSSGTPSPRHFLRKIFEAETLGVDLSVSGLSKTKARQRPGQASFLKFSISGASRGFPQVRSVSSSELGSCEIARWLKRWMRMWWGQRYRGPSTTRPARCAGRFAQDDDWMVAATDGLKPVPFKAASGRFTRRGSFWRGSWVGLPCSRRRGRSRVG